MGLDMHMELEKRDVSALICFLTVNINSPKLLTSKEEFCFYPCDLVSLRLLCGSAIIPRV